MGDRSKIQWTNATWNCIRGCSRVSRGCEHCYAERIAARFSAPGLPYEGLAIIKNGDPRWTGEVRFIEERLQDPIRWKRPRMIFVNSMSDLFHEKVQDNWISQIFSVMEQAPQHTFQILTKRPQRMREWMLKYYGWLIEKPWPGLKNFSHVWLGVSVEDQETADKRIPLLLETPAAVRWVSYEPALGPVDFNNHLFIAECDVCGNRANPEGTIEHGRGCYTQSEDGGGTSFEGHGTKLNWLVVGGESGPEARPFDLRWARDTIRQCKAAGVACFVKQLGSDPFDSSQPGRPHLKFTHGHAGDMSEWPEDLRVQEFPNGAKTEEGRLPDLRLHAE
jgi:protein gp37